ncbi:hypothetical protein RvY_19093 [Ramazzottius varieornatus]|uniref:F-box domain-containing protein n=1 Tax=Ramazzottius varieornatus TaxID=947166 RepID=A0A1D1W878_RAMVA|nr:hypothetical protein RvY_19093 [Ramazzottius varieornatus]
METPLAQNSLPDNHLGRHLARLFSLSDLPEEIMYEIFFEVESTHQRRLSRVSKSWQKALSSTRLQKVVRLDILASPAGVHAEFEFTSFPDVREQMREAGEPSVFYYHAIYELNRLYKLLTVRTTVLQLNWKEWPHIKDCNILDVALAWSFHTTLARIIKRKTFPPLAGVGVNVRHILLHNAWALDGVHNLHTVTKTRERANVPWTDYTRPIRTLVLRQCRFAVAGRFVSFFAQPGKYQDCQFRLVPAECSSWVRIPLLILDFTTTEEETNERTLVSAVDLHYERPPDTVLETLAAKVEALSEAAKERWRMELIR